MAFPAWSACSFATRRADRPVTHQRPGSDRQGNSRCRSMMGIASPQPSCWCYVGVSSEGAMSGERRPRTVATYLREIARVPLLAQHDEHRLARALEAGTYVQAVRTRLARDPLVAGSHAYRILFACYQRLVALKHVVVAVCPRMARVPTRCCGPWSGSAHSARSTARKCSAWPRCWRCRLKRPSTRLLKHRR